MFIIYDALAHRFIIEPFIIPEDVPVLGHGDTTGWVDKTLFWLDTEDRIEFIINASSNLMDGVFQVMFDFDENNMKRDMKEYFDNGEITEITSFVLDKFHVEKTRTYCIQKTEEGDDMCWYQFVRYQFTLDVPILK